MSLRKVRDPNRDPEDEDPFSAFRWIGSLVVLGLAIYAMTQGF